MDERSQAGLDLGVLGGSVIAAALGWRKATIPGQEVWSMKRKGRKWEEPGAQSGHGQEVRRKPKENHTLQTQGGKL